MSWGTHVVIYLSSKSLHIYSDITKNEETFEFPANVAQYAEIVDKTAYIKLLTEFLTSLKLGNKKAYAVFSPQLVFEKTLARQANNELKEQFYASVPFETEVLVKKELQQKDSLKLFVTNRDFCQGLIEGCHNARLNILAIAPLSLFGEIKNNEALDLEAATNILHHHNIFKQVNFLDNLPQQVSKKDFVELQYEEEKSTSKTSLKQYIFLIISLLILAGAIFFALVTYDVISVPLPFQERKDSRNLLTTIPNINEATPSASSQATDSGAIQESSTQSLKVKIVYEASNSAKLVRDSLVELGFKNIQEEKTATKSAETKILTTGKLPSSLKEEVTAALESFVDKITTEEKSSIEDVDLHITIGPVKR